MRRYVEDPVNKARAVERQRERRKVPAVRRRRCENERKYKTGCTPELFAALLATQNGACALCPATRGSVRKATLFADHDHRTGRVRGLLCQACNMVLGALGDTPESISATAFATPRVLAYLTGPLV